nr:hypothetical protein [Tanacetum cinerariifolium]
MHEVVHEMVVGECHEPNSKGSGSAWKAYINARVAGLFLLVLLEYPNGKGVDETSEPLLYAGWMAGPYRCKDAMRGRNDDPVTSVGECHEPNSEGSGSTWKAYMNARVAGLFLLVLLEYPNNKGVDDTSEPLLYAGWMAGPYRCKDATRGRNDDLVTSGCRSSVRMTMHEVIHEMVVGECHEPNYEGSGSALKAYINARVAGLFLLVLLEYPNRCRSSIRMTMHEVVHEMVAGECHEPNSERSGSAWKAYINARVVGLFRLVLLEYHNGCRSSVRMTMHEVVHEMVVGECHEPNSEGSGSAWKAYMNARVAGLFLLVLLEYPNSKGVDETSEPLLYAGWMAGPYRCKDATRGRNDDPVTSGIKRRLDRGGSKQNRSRCRSSVRMTMHEVVHKMVVGECHEPNSEGSGSAWKAYINTRVAGLFLLVLLEYPNGKGVDETSEPLLYARWMAGPYRCKDATRGQNDDPVISGIKSRLDQDGPKQNRSSCSPKKFLKVLAAQSQSKAKSFEGCRSSVRMTMHEVVHEMVVGECHEPNSEGSGSAWKAYMNARVAGLFLLVLLEYPNGKGEDETSEPLLYAGWMAGPYWCKDATRGRNDDPVSVVSYRVSTRDTYYTLTVGDETSEPLLYAGWMAGPYRCKDATRGRNDDLVASGIKSRLDQGGPKQNRLRCRSSVRMTMHEVVHEMVVGECHEPNSEGSGSAWKAYMNARVAGLFLLVLLEYPIGCRSSVRMTMHEDVHEMVVGECHEPNSKGSGSVWKAYINARVAGLFLLVLLEYPNGCRSSMRMTMHEVVHEMVVGECHEPNSEGSGSAWKAYINARVAGLFLLVFLEYPNGKGVVRVPSRDSI